MNKIKSLSDDEIQATEAVHQPIVTTSREVMKWLDSGEYLPPVLRDFHAQKDLFKFIGLRVETKRRHTESSGSSDYMYEDFNWCRFHVVCIDFFLWYMAANGWTLQRSRKPLPFDDYAATIKNSREEWAEYIYTTSGFGQK